MDKRNLTSARACSTLVDLLCWWALHQPHRCAYTFLHDGETEEASLTYAELDCRSRAIAAALQALGAAGERVLLVFPSSLEYLAAFFGCLYAGAIAVPMYPPDTIRPERTLPRFRAIVNDAQPCVALTTSPILSLIRPFVESGPELQALNWLPSDSISNNMAGRWQTPAVTGASIAFLQYTSGSIAAPKGVMVSHGNVLYNQQMLKTVWGTTEEYTLISWLPLFHDMGLIGVALHACYAGARGVLMEPRDFLLEPFRWLQAITRYQAHISGAPNFAYDLCVHKIAPAQRATLNLSSWEVAFNGAEPVRAATLRRFVETFEPYGFQAETLWPAYGLAEATVFAAGGRKTAPPRIFSVRDAALEHGQVIVSDDQDDSRQVVGCGQAWLDEKITIVDPETRRRCVSGQVGEIWLSGSNIAQGYWQRTQETEDTFQARLADTGAGPFLRTGDLGFVIEDELVIAGRIKDLIILDGRNLYPQDIEFAAEESHPAVRRGCCAAFSVDVANEERLVIVAEVNDRYRRPIDGGQVGTDSRSAQAASLRSEIVGAIRQAVVKTHDVRAHDVVLIKQRSISKTSSGKIQRRTCRARYIERTLEQWDEQGAHAIQA